MTSGVRPPLDSRRKVTCRCHDWDEIERDYRAGDKTVAQIAREQGISGAAIHNRASLRGWVRGTSFQVRRRADARQRVACRCHDWAAIERDYRAGIKPVAQIGREQGITFGAIHNRATLRGWQRDQCVRAQRRAEAKRARKAALEARRELGRAVSSLTWAEGDGGAEVSRLAERVAPLCPPMTRGVHPPPGRPRRAPRWSHDWDEIERDYRAGVKSISQIAREQEISCGAIHQRARLLGWERDLRDQVYRRAQERLAREPGLERGGGDAAPGTAAAQANDRATRGDEGEAIVHLVRGHREDLLRLRRTLLHLNAPLEAYLDVLAAWPDGDQAPDPPPALVRVLGPRKSPADLLLQVTRVIARLIGRERRAFGLHQACAPLPPDPEALAERDRAILAEIRAEVTRQVEEELARR